MKAIPKRLLIHTVMLHKKAEFDRWGKIVQMDDGMKVSHVRMEPSSKIVRDKNNAEIQLSATLFYDCKNSTPKVAFEVDNVIRFNGLSLKVQTVESFYDEKKMHHYELGLVADGKNYSKI